MEVHNRSFSILLVEDNPAEIALAKEALRESSIPCSMTVLRDGQEAMLYLLREKQYVEAEFPDLILLDLNLPKKNGLEVLKEIKSTPYLKRIPVIVLTCSDSEQDFESACDINANCYIVKPVNFDTFSKVIKSIVVFWSTIARMPKK